MIDAALNDRRLARAMLAGREEAFEEFFEAHFARVYRFALARLNGDEDAAEEVTQVTLSKAISRLRTYRGEASLLTWLCAFCRHEISDRFRRRGAAGRQVPLVEDAPEVRAALETLPAADRDGPDGALNRKEVARLVQVALDSLPFHYGNALEWKYIDELSVGEIAARLELSPKAAESLLTRAREAFRERFAALAGGPLAWSAPLPSSGRTR